MEAARHSGSVLVATCCFWVAVFANPAAAQNARSQNFLVHAPTAELARAVAEHAEKYRDELAMHWLGRRLPPWPTPCPITVIAGPQLAAQGVTTYDRAPVGNFRMEVVGTPERILDSVLPHEVNHTVLATHFGRPIPRWADEGICTTVEHAEERDKHEMKLREFLGTRRGIAMNRLFLLTEYPNDMLPLYAQGYSVCRFLIEQEGPRRFIQFIEGYLSTGSWTENVRNHYGYESLAKLQQNWLAWVAQGSGSVDAFVSAKSKAAASLASSGSRTPAASSPAPAVRLAANVTPRSEPDSASQLAMNGPIPAQPAATAVGATSELAAPTADGSWYKRRREQTALGKVAPDISPPAGQAGQSGIAGQAGIAIAPPSVAQSGRYSASQPQSEIRYGQSASMSTSQRSAAMYR